MWLMGCQCFVASRDASLLYMTVAAVLILPAAEKTRGVNVLCSISLFGHILFVFPFRAVGSRRLG